MFVFCYLKFAVLIYKTEIDILATKLDSFYDESFVFDHSNGLAVAAAFTGWNNKNEYELDKSIGEFIFINYQWGYDEDGTFFLKRDRIPSHVEPDSAARSHHGTHTRRAKRSQRRHALVILRMAGGVWKLFWTK